MTRKFYLFAVMTALFLLAPTSLLADQSGSCGENITWTMDDYGVLTIEGTGAMTDYNCWESPFEPLSPAPQELVIKGEVTTIGNYAFYYCTGLQSVDISGSVTSIGQYAFSECVGLEYVTISSPVKSIGSDAFGNCCELTSITLPSSVTSIGDYAFGLCSELTKIESLAETPPTCGSNSFFGVDMSKCVLIVPANSVEAYKAAEGWKDFAKTEAVSGDGTQSGTCGDNITWTLDGDGVLTLEGTGAMTDYGYMSPAPWKDLSVKTAVIGEGITTIGNLMFYENSELTSVTIPGTVTSIGENAFSLCSSLESVTIPSSVTTINQMAFYGCDGLKSVNIPNSVTSIGDAAFCNCTGLKSLFIPSSVTSIGSDAFTGCSGLESITVDSENSTYDSRRSCNAIIETSTNTIIAGCKNAYIPSNVTSIGGSAFYNVGLTSVTIPASVTSIRDGAFAYCTELQKIEFYGGNAPTLGEDVFEEVDKSNCTLYATDYTTYMVNKQFQNFINCETLYPWTNSGTCGDGVNWMLHAQGVLEIEGTGAMNDFEDLGFNACPWKYLSYTKVAIGEGVTTIGNKAFQNNAELTSVTIPNSVTSIGDFAFNSCEGLTSVDIPSFVTSIGSYSFYLCDALPSVTIPSTVTNIGGMAFYDCWGLRKIESLAETPPTCGDDAFGGVSPDVCVLYVPKKSVEAYKTANEWKNLTKIEALPVKVVATGDCGDNITWTLDADGVLTLEGTGAMTDFDDPFGAPWHSLTVTKAVIGEGITTIGVWAFIDCKGLTSVDIPNSVTSIGHDAFLGCTGLTSVDIPNSVTSIAHNAFSECTGLTSVTIPSSVTKIDIGTFAMCTGLKEVTCLAVTPPTCSDDAFYETPIANCVLYVPEASIEAYKAADVWKEFSSIVTTGINAVTLESNVVEVYSTSGMLVYRGSSNTVNVPSAGIYVVKAAGKTYKVNIAK